MLEEFVKKLNDKIIIVGSSALACNGLVAGYVGYDIWTKYPFMNKVPLDNGIVLEHYHFHDDYQLEEISEKVFLPSVERSLIDTMVWYQENSLEGFLIEALQDYQYHEHKVSELYECADHYLVPHEVVDYWWNEALEESDMSMG